MAADRPSDRRKMLAAYISDRLSSENEAEGRGYFSRVAKETKFTRPHVSTVAANKKGVGEDFVEAIAQFWKMSVEDLTSAASAWAEGRTFVQGPAATAAMSALVESIIRSEKLSPGPASQLRQTPSWGGIGWGRDLLEPYARDLQRVHEVAMMRAQLNMPPSPTPAPPSPDDVELEKYQRDEFAKLEKKRRAKKRPPKPKKPKGKP